MSAFVGFALIIFSVILFSFWLVVNKALFRLQHLSKRNTYSSNKTRALYSSGVYIEHGMVNQNNNSSELTPQSKPSKTLIESII